MKLFKYRADNEYTEKIFIDKQVWLSNAAKLNDPFECTITEIASDWIESEVKKLKSIQILGFMQKAEMTLREKKFFFDLNPKQTKEFLNKFKKKDFESRYRTVKDFIFRKTNIEISNPKATFKNIDSLLNKIGIFSLSELDTNELMWAHYAGSSTGIALGFEKSINSKLSTAKNCLKVEYCNQRPMFTGDALKTEIAFCLNSPNMQQISFEDSTFRQAISTKNTIWEYECEWRYIEPNSGSFDFPGELTEVIFGLKCPIDTRNKYIKLAKRYINNQIDFYEIVISRQTNKFEKVKYIVN